MGATTQFTASDAAEGMGFLAQAGLKAEEIVSALPESLKLAAAAQVGLGESSDIVTNVMAGFGLAVDELPRATDVLTKAFTSANTNLTQLAEAIKFAGSTVSSGGVGFEEGTAALALMGNAGLQASIAGTSLRGAVARLLSPTAKNAAIMKKLGINLKTAEGQMKPLSEVVRQLTPHVKDAGLFMQLFGQRAGPGMLVLTRQGVPALQKLTEELKNSGGTADRIAKAQMKGFIGSMRELKSAFEAIQLAIAESGLLKFVTDIAKRLASWFRELSKTNPKILKWGTIIAGVTAVVGPLLAALGLMVAAITPLIALFAGVGGAMAGIAAAAAGVTAAFAIWEKEIVEKIRKTVDGIKEQLVGRFNKIVESVKQKVQAVTGFFKSMFDKVVGNSFVPDMVNGIQLEFGRLDRDMVSPAESATSAITTSFKSMGNNVSSSIKGWVKTGKFEIMSFEDFISNAFSNIANQALSAGIGGFGFGGAVGSGILGGFQNLLGFRSGGGFTVGGSGGVDKSLVAFRATRGERVTVDKDGGRRGGDVNVFVENHTGGQVTTSKRRNANGGLDLRVVVEDLVSDSISNNGKVARAITNNFNSTTNLVGR